jgi:hypothetical protein
MNACSMRFDCAIAYEAWPGNIDPQLLKSLSNKRTCFTNGCGTRYK